MRWLITGGNGMLANDVRDQISARGHDVTSWDIDTLDITNSAQVFDLVTGFDAVVNCAAWVNAESAEENEAKAFALNSLGPAYLSAAAARTGAVIAHISTDYVFGGYERSAPFDEDSPAAPLSVYGRTKLSGEWGVRAHNPRHYVFRTAWLYGSKGPCFPMTIAKFARDRDTLTVIDDQRGQPTWAKDVAAKLVEVVTADAPAGVYHLTSSGEASWYEFARAIAEADGTSPDKIAPITSAEFAQKAPRPAYSVLGHDRLRAAGIEPIGLWDERWTIAAPSILPQRPL